MRPLPRNPACRAMSSARAAGQRGFFHEESLPHVPLAGPTPSDDDGGEPAGLFRLPGQCGVAGRQEAGLSEGTDSQRGEGFWRGPDWMEAP
jgi:hypothetical protein